MKKVLSLFILSALVFSLGSAFAQTGADWKWQNPVPQGNTLRWVKIWDANTSYAIGFTGTFIKTTNAGVTWTFNHMAGRDLGLSGQKTSMYDAHFFNQNTGVAVGAGSATAPSYGSGIVRTTNGGTTWDTVSVNPFTTSAIFYMVYFKDNNTGYAVGTVTPKLYKTTDAGLTWNGITTAPTTTLYDVYSPDSLNIIVSTTAGNVQKSTNAGATFTMISTGASATLYRMEFTNANTGFVTGTSSAFRYTTNGGLNWTTPANTGLPASSTFWDLDVRGTSIFLTGLSTYIYKSTDMGSTWDTLGFQPPTQPWSNTYYASDFSFTGDSLVTVGAFGLMNRRLSFANRTSFVNPVRLGIVYDIWAQGLGTGNVIAVGVSSLAGTVYDQISRSTNGGNTWTIVPYSTTSRTAFNDIEMINDNTGYACGTLGAIYRTTNAGANWDSVNTNGVIAGTLNLSKADFINVSTGWVFAKTTVTGDSSTIFKTTDAGATWTKQRLSPEFSAMSGYQIYGSHMLDANTGYCLNYTPRPYMTTNGGATWDSMSTIDYYGGFLYGIEMLNANTGYIAGGGGRVYKTTNAGLLWDTLSLPTRSYTNYAVDFVNPLVGMIIGSTGTCWYTTNGGADWTSKNTNATNATMYGCQMLPNTISFGVGSSGVMMKNSNIITGVAGIETETPKSFALMQNYPNPFNPVTTISFSLPKVAVVTLKIYDVAGREVMRLVNNRQFGAGIQKMQFNGSTLSSGVYFYSLTVDNNLVDTKKMVLLK